MLTGLILSCSNDEQQEENLDTNKNIYLFKRNYENINNQVSLIKYSLDNSTETIIYNLGNDFDENDSFASFGKINSIFHPSKNEIITLNTQDFSLLRVNLTNGIETKQNLNAASNESYNGLMISNTEEIYLFKRRYENNIEQVSLVKYDIDNSNETLIYELGNDFDQNINLSSYDGINVIFHPSKNEIITLNTGDFTNTGVVSLLRVNLINGTETKHILNVGNIVKYNGLIISNTEEIYLFKRKYENNNYHSSLVKYDLDNSTETLIYNLGNDFDQNSSFSSYSGINAVYNPSKNEIITLNTEDSSILRVSLTNGAESKHILNVGNFENYNGLIIK
mgnify:CR=1 FL=1